VVGGLALCLRQGILQHIIDFFRLQIPFVDSFASPRMCRWPNEHRKQKLVNLQDYSKNYFDCEGHSAKDIL
jgi:hypothetical protein